MGILQHAFHLAYIADFCIIYDEVLSNPCLKDIPSLDIQETLRKVFIMCIIVDENIKAVLIHYDKYTTSNFRTDNYNAQNIIFLSFPIRYIQFQVYTEELRKVMDNELEIRFECGYTKKPSSQITLSDREKIVKTIWLHYVYFLPHAELI